MTVRTARPIPLFALALALVVPGLAAAQEIPTEGTTIPVLEGNEPSLAPPPGGQPVDGVVPPSSPDPSAAFLEALSPYGSWIAMEGFGLVWQPDPRVVGSAYTPYVTGGHWEMTNVGWVFASDQAFGWAVYHYGRWLYDDEYGWVWAPGTEWGASWVDWQMADGYVGWAPLPPAGYAYPAGYGPSYVFVSINYLTSYDLWPYLVSGAGVGRYVEMAAPCGYGWYQGRSWPYGPGASVFASAGVPIRGVVIPVPPSGHVYRGSVEVNATPSWASVPVRSSGGVVTAGSVAVRDAGGRGSVAVTDAGGRGTVAVNAPPPPWTATAPRWGSTSTYAPTAAAVAPRYAGDVPGIHSVVQLHTPTNIAPRYVTQATNIAPRFVPQATNYARPPPMRVPEYVGQPSMAAAPAGVASWRAPSYGAGFAGTAPSYAPAPSYGGGGFAARPSFGGGGAVYNGGGSFGGGGSFAARPSFGGGGGAVYNGGGGFGGGFHPAAPAAAPSYRPAPSFGGGGAAVFGGGGGFRPSMGGFRR